LLQKPLRQQNRPVISYVRVEPAPNMPENGPFSRCLILRGKYVAFLLMGAFSPFTGVQRAGTAQRWANQVRQEGD
jgi:hypothetical protein